MQCVLNFSPDEKAEVIKRLKKFPELGTKTEFEELRCRIGKSQATLYSSGKLLIQGPDCASARERILDGLKLDENPVLGIDEAGRGESFGSFVIAGVLASPGAMRELRDSKKTRDLKGKAGIVERNALAISVFKVSARELGLLHEKGLNLNQMEAMAINAMAGFFRQAGFKGKVVVDGSPLKGCSKEISFLVKGDDLNPVVGAASVVARNARDNSGDLEKRAGWGSWGKK